jgi:hypothetical protein
MKSGGELGSMWEEGIIETCFSHEDSGRIKPRWRFDTDNSRRHARCISAQIVSSVTPEDVEQ